MERGQVNRNRVNHITFGLGTIGRDMIYSLVSMYLIYYLTDILELSSKTLWWVTAIILFARIFDAANDPSWGLLSIIPRADSANLSLGLPRAHSYPEFSPCFFLRILA